MDNAVLEPEVNLTKIFTKFDAVSIAATVSCCFCGHKKTLQPLVNSEFGFGDLTKLLRDTTFKMCQIAGGDNSGSFQPICQSCRLRLNLPVDILGEGF